MKGKKKPVKKLLVVLCAAVFVLTAIADVAAFAFYSDSLDKAFPAAKGDETVIKNATENALATAQEIEEEGVVLLENDGALPLDKKQKINLLGYASCHPIYAGSGSGGSAYQEYKTDFADAFQQAGFELNQDLVEMYSKMEGEAANTFQVDFSIKEPAATEELASKMGQDYSYTGECSFDQMKEFSDTAVIVISRKGGEGNDLPVSMEEYTDYLPDQSKHYLEINSAEQSLIDTAKSTFNKVIVMINAGNAMELGFLENDGKADPGKTGDVDAALFVGGIGDMGSIGVANILNGTVNPSGRLVDTYPYAVETIPSYYNFDTYEYTNSSECFTEFDSHPAYLIEYQEGIYVGYRYFETRESYDYITREGEQMTGLSYEEVVQYPFGYGLSYSEFEWKVSNVTEEGPMDKDGQIEVQVDVTNTGKAAGKEVVELYYTPPYNSQGSRIQKSQVVLGGFVKTGLIQPGETETVKVVLDVQDMVSYDDQKYYSETGSYVLEEGDYVISLRRDAHTLEDSFTYQLDETVVFADETDAVENRGNAVYVGKRISDQVTAVNQFDDVAGDVAYMERDTWNITEGSSKEATQEQLEAFRNALSVDEGYIKEEDKAPAFGAKNGLTISDLSGKDYDDPQWEQLLDQLKLEDMNTMLAMNGWGSAKVSSVGKPQTYDMDGPAALSYVFDAFMGTCTYETVTYPGEVILASSWNVELADKFGEAIAKEGEAWSISGWYAPGANIHRNPFTGRNFEYYSEDGYLSGAMASAVVKAATENGMYCYMKHFVLNEMETNRHYGLCTWASEQSMREIYFVPFEIAVKEGKTTALMSSYNNLGTTWAGGSRALLTNVLRNEWGFVGTVLTDNNEEHGFMNPEVAIAAGGTALLYNGMQGPKSLDTLASTASGQKLLREAAHQYLYTVANSYVPDLKQQLPVWRIPAIVCSVFLYILSIGGFLLLIRKKKRSVIEIDK